MKFLVVATRTDEYEVEVEANTDGEAAHIAREVIQYSKHAVNSQGRRPRNTVISYWDNLGELTVDGVYRIPEDEA